jgi:hypothetical protein
MYVYWKVWIGSLFFSGRINIDEVGVAVAFQPEAGNYLSFYPLYARQK